MSINIFAALELLRTAKQRPKVITDNASRQLREQLPSFHRTPIQTHFSDRVIFSDGTEGVNRPLIVLAFTNRSGSNLLADYLRQTNLLGGLGEYLNHETVIRKSSIDNANSFPEYIKNLAYKLSLEGQFFGVKASAEQLQFISDWNILEMFSSTLVVHIHRDDIFSQAISHWIAWQTGQWTSLQKKNPVSLKFDGPKINQIITDIISANNEIHLHCFRRNIGYISVSYEEVIADPKAAVSRIATAAKLDCSTWQPSRPKLSKQSDKENKKMLSQFHCYLNEL